MITATVTQSLANWAALTDVNYYALIMMIREFLLRDQTLNSSMLASVYEAMRPFYVWPKPFCHPAKELLQYLEFRRKAPAVTNCLEYLSDHPELLSKRRVNPLKLLSLLTDFSDNTPSPPDSKQEEFIHVIINEESVYGQALKEMLSQQPQPSSAHSLRARFLQVFYKAYFENEPEIWNFALMDQIIVNNLFNKAVEIVMKIASV